MLRLVPPKPGQMVCDPGCGDGRILTKAVLDYDAKAFGIEINPETARIARDRIAVLGLDEEIVVTTGDSRKYDLGKAEIVYMYLYEELINKLISLGRIPPSAIVVSYAHPFTGSEEVEFDGHVFYVRMPE